MPFNIRRGDVITLEMLQSLYDGAPAGRIRSSGGISSRQSPDGSTQIWGVANLDDLGFLAVTNGSVSANAVVTTGIKWTPGTGTVYAVDYDGTNLNADTSTTYDVLNFSTTTGGIPTNTLVWVTTDGSTDSDGDFIWYVVAIDCGN